MSSRVKQLVPREGTKTTPADLAAVTGNNETTRTPRGDENQLTGNLFSQK